MTDFRNWDPTDRVRGLSDRMVRWPSETGTADEAEFAERLAGLLREIPYFHAHPQQVQLVQSHGDPLTSSVVALVRGTGRRTLAMAGHFDVVAVDNYRDLAHLAFEPDALLQALLDDLGSRELSASEARALADFRTGDFIPGRGMLDMKSGIAAGIAVLEQFATTPDRDGNLLLIVTPDEERGSRGMRSLRDALPSIAARFDISIEAGINLDATSDQGDGTEGRAIYRGSIGKSLPFAFVVGQSSHASYPFEGVSAQLIAAELTLAIEANTDFCDRGGTQVSPTPICLESKDLRGGYEVTTPERVWLAFNWLSHSWRPHELLERFAQACQSATDRALVHFNAQAAAYAALLNTPQSPPVTNGKIIGIPELREAVLAAGGHLAVQRLAALETSLQSCDDPLLLTRTVVNAMVNEAGLTGPAIVVGFSSLVYPNVSIEGLEGSARFADAIEAARLAFEAAGHDAVKYRDYFTGISDMSFFGHHPRDTDSRFVAAATPASQLIDKVDAGVLEFPVVNIGPWGREYHQRHERLFAPYAFRDLPRLLGRIVDVFLRG